MAVAEGLVFFLFPEQGLQSGHFELNLHAFLQLFHQGGQRNGLLLLSFQGSAHGGKQVRILRVNGGFLRQMQCADKGCLQLRQEVQRPAQEGNTAPDGFAAGKTRNGLVHHRLENGSCQVGLGGTVVD